MENFISRGDVVTVAAPSNLNSGQGFLVGNLFAVAVTAVASAANVAAVTEGVLSLPKANAVSTSAAAGSNVHWDATNARTTFSATSNLKIGVLLAAVANTDTAAIVRLSGAW